MLLNPIVFYGAENMAEGLMEVSRLGIMQVHLEQQP